MLERGLGEYSPFGLLNKGGREAMSQGGSAARRRLAMAGLGTAAAGAGYAGNVEDPLALTLSGPLAPMMLLGGLMNTDEGSSATTTDNIERALAGMGRTLPGVQPLTSAERYIARLAPNFGRDVAHAIDPVEERETPGLFGEATSKTPFLRQSLPAVGGGGQKRKQRPQRARREKRETR
jgi:hypothetical protein